MSGSRGDKKGGGCMWFTLHRGIKREEELEGRKINMDLG